MILVTVILNNSGWGIGIVLALQVCYSHNGPNGLLYLQPLRRTFSCLGSCLLVQDTEAEVASTRAVDRLEVLQGTRPREDGSVELEEYSAAHMRAVLSGMVFLDGVDDY